MGFTLTASTVTPAAPAAAKKKGTSSGKVAVKRSAPKAASPGGRRLVVTILEGPNTHGEIGAITGNNDFAYLHLQAGARLRQGGRSLTAADIKEGMKLVCWGEWDRYNTEVFDATAVSVQGRLDDYGVRQKIGDACRNVSQHYVHPPVATVTEVPSAPDPTSSAETAPAAKGKSAPDFTAIDRGGKPVKLSDFKGKVVILDFWASWCGPCISSMPHNQEVAKKLQSEGLPVALLAVANSEERGTFLTWVQEHKELDAITFAHADPKTDDIAGKLYSVTGIPAQFVIDAKGMICASFVGYGGPSDHLEKAVRTALSTK
jgi:thiol-disulfide isomerase/thioredoxin